MVYYILAVFSRLIPGEARRRRFLDGARSRFSVKAMIETATADSLRSIERSIYYHTYLFEAPDVLTVDQTLDALIDGSSIARFGDGELLSLEQKQNAFQRPDARLAARLAEVLAAAEPGLLIGVFAHSYRLTRDLTDYERAFYIHDAPWMHAIEARYLQPGETYGATEVTLAHQIYREGFDRAEYFRRVRLIWEGEKVVLVHGDGIFDGFVHDIFDNAASVDHVLAPKQDAFDEYDVIVERVCEKPKDSVVIAILGPTATVLAFDLHRAGYRALDLGHIAKSYEWWLTGRTAEHASANDDFFSAD